MSIFYKSWRMTFDIDLSNLSAEDDVNVNILQELEDDFMILTLIICQWKMMLMFIFDKSWRMTL